MSKSLEGLLVQDDHNGKSFFAYYITVQGQDSKEQNILHNHFLPFATDGD